jgi:hypothetical protein
MAVIQYTLLFQIECLHGYFGGGPCRSLNLTPTEDCRQLLARHQMLFRPGTGCGAVYRPRQSPDLLTQFDEIGAFTFALTSNDPALDIYTDMDAVNFNPGESLFHFDNRSDFAGEVAGQPRRLLHTPGKPFAEAVVSVRPKLFSVAAPGKPAVGSLRITEPVGNQTIWQAPIPAKAAPVPVDLRGIPEGLYLLDIAGQAARQFYLSDQLPSRRWGVISIYPGGSRQAGSLPEHCRVIDSDGTPRPVTFTLALESRKTIWRYYVIPSTEEQNFAQYEVFSATKKATGQSGWEGELHFDLLPATVPVDSRSAWVFESKSPLPFMLSPASTFSLSLRPSKNGKMGQRAIRLPYAQPRSLVRKEGSEQKHMCSEIFVYV